MKHLLLFSVIAFWGWHVSNAQNCSEVEIILSDQESVDQFASNYPDCQTAIDRLIIEGNDITNLQGLSSIRHCSHLYIQNAPNLQSLEGLSALRHVVYMSIVQTGISNMNGLENLDTIGFLFHLSGNAQLKDLSGLDGLDKMFTISISECDAFQSFNGLPPLAGIYALMLEYNHSLVNLTGFTNISEVENIYIAHNDNLTNLSGLESITALKGDISILANPKLTSLQGLNFLEEVRNIEIIENGSLVDLQGLDALQHIRGTARIQGNPQLTSLAGLHQLDTISNAFEIISNPVLRNLDGLEALTFVRDYFQVDENPQLSDITSLLQLDQVGGLLLISQNDQLTSLSGLDQIQSLGDLEITFNDVLEVCSVESICQYLTNGGHAVVGGNKDGCINTNQILEGCLVGTEDISVLPLLLYPNPARAIVHIPEPITHLEVFNVMGQRYPVEYEGGYLEVSDLPSGVYIVRGQKELASHAGTFVKI